MLNTAFVFPGQGSQSVGMLADLAGEYPIVQDLFAQVSNRLGYDLWSLVQHGPATQLNQTEYTQVAMLVADVAIFTVLKQQGFPAISLMAGHSLGEYAALVCAGALTIEDAALLVARRGQLMQETVPLGVGAMAAIVGLSAERVETLCRELSTPDSQVAPANYNAIGQVVIAGHTAAVTKAMQQAEQLGAQLALTIPVSVPCHCSLLKEAAIQFDYDLKKTIFNVPQIPILTPVDLTTYDTITHMRETLREQLYLPVRWVETIQAMKQRGVELIIECGPGKVLGGLIKRIDRSIEVLSVNDQASVNAALTRVTH